MTSGKSHIYGNMTWILPRNSEFDGRFSVMDTFSAGLGGYPRRKSPGLRAERSASSFSTGKRVH